MAMKKYRVIYKDMNGITREHSFAAMAEDVDLGNVIMEWVDNEYNVDSSQTDGTDVWYTDQDGEQIIVMRGMEVEEEND